MSIERLLGVGGQGGSVGWKRVESGLGPGGGEYGRGCPQSYHPNCGHTLKEHY